MLPAATQAEILRLVFAEHWSLSEIARHLAVQRASGRKVVRRRSVAPTRAAPRPRTTVLTPFVARIQALLVQAPTRAAGNVLQVRRAEGYRGGIRALRALVRRLRPGPTREAFVPLRFGVAEGAQIDWGEFGDVFGIGRPVHAFVLVLAYSRLLTLGFTFSQTLEAFLRCHEQAWTFVGGPGRPGTTTSRPRSPSGGGGSSAPIPAPWPTRGTTASGRWPAMSGVGTRRAAWRTRANTCAAASGPGARSAISPI